MFELEDLPGNSSQKRHHTFLEHAKRSDIFGREKSEI